VHISVQRTLAASIRLQLLIALVFALFQPGSHAVPAPIVLADRIVVTKSTHTLVLYSHGAVLRTYKVALGRAAGAKQYQGDNRTPVGHYRIDAHNAHSTCHLSLHVSYPNPDDRARALAAHQKPGGDIMIHGLPNGLGYIGGLHRATDWTYGCIAVTDAEMDEIYRLVPNNTPIEIEP
jgi:murein L,D-transpeptidase YafK